MKKIKYLFLIILVLLFTGCTGDYNLKINRDLSVEEELKVSIDNVDDSYERTYKLLEQLDISENDYEVVVDMDKVNITYKKKYSSFEDYYLDSNIYKILFKDIELSKDNTGMTLKAESNFKLDSKNNLNVVNAYDIDKLNINLNIPFDVNKSNADSVKDNIYTWTLNRNDTYKEISIDYSYQNDRAQNIIVLVVLGLIFIATISYGLVILSRNQRI